MIALIPLDERPVNVRYPQMIADIAGVDLLLPPVDLLSRERQPAPDQLNDWLLDHAGQIDALIVSCEMLGYGGLMASRITNDPPLTIVQRLDALRQLRQQRPTLPIYGFNLITRVSNANHNVEEPEYWLRHGEQLHRLSELLDRAACGQSVHGELERVQQSIPQQHVDDFLRRRLRNHTVNLAILQLLAEGVFDLLVLSSDDTAEFGLGTREKRWLHEWVDLLNVRERLLMYPGADEVGCVLLARLINERNGRTPSFRPFYAVPERAELVAPYEDEPIRETVRRQVQAVGGVLTLRDDADYLLGINPPDPCCFEYEERASADGYHQRALPLNRFVSYLLNAERPPVLVDVAYPNGSDPHLINLLLPHLTHVNDLTAYSAWNTAGNTIGTALAQACAALEVQTEKQRRVQTQFTLHRFVEDWGYQRVVRAQARAWLQGQGLMEPPTAWQESAAFVERELSGLLKQIPGSEGWRIRPNSVSFPWRRLFEIDFELEHDAALAD